METTRYMTPYEKFIRENIEVEKKHLDDLYTEFARSGPLEKQILKGKIDEANQNIELLSRELKKYASGLSWLREPSKDRDEKAEHLEKIQEEPAQPKPSAPAPSTPARPTVGTPRPTVGTPRPSVGTPVGAPKPTVGTPVGAKVAVTETKTTPTAPPVSRPQVGTPRPVVGTPIIARPRVGTPKPSEEKTEEVKDESGSDETKTA